VSQDSTSLLGCDSSIRTSWVGLVKKRKRIEERPDNTARVVNKVLRSMQVVMKAARRFPTTFEEKANVQKMLL